MIQIGDYGALAECSPTHSTGNPTFVMSNPSISVVIITKNRPRLLAQCLDSLRRQTVKPLEMIVIDGSDSVQGTGYSAQLTNQLNAKRYPLNALRFFTDPSCSISIARNLGWRKCRGDIVVYLDDDLAAAPDYLARIRTHFAKNTQLDCVVGKITNAIPDNIVAATMIAFYERGLTRMYKNLSHPSPLASGRMLDCEVMGIRRNVLRQIPLPERPSGHRHDDVELGLLLTKAKKQILFDPTIVVSAYPRTSLIPFLSAITRDGYWDACIEKIYRIRVRDAKFTLPFLPWMYRTVRTSPFRPLQRIWFGILLCLYPVISRIGKFWFILRTL